MTDFNINPYGQSAVMPEGYPLSNSLDEDNAQKALSAAMGYKLARMGGGRHWYGKTWYAYGASLTEFGRYTTALASLSGMICTNKGLGGKGIMVGNHEVRDAIMNNTDGKVNADLITVEVMGNEMSASLPFGTVFDGINTDGSTPSNPFSTYLGCLVQCILYLQRNTHAQIVIMPYTQGRYQYQHPENLTPPNNTVTDASTGITTTIAERREQVKRVCNMYGVYYVDPNNALGWARKLMDYNNDGVDDYLYDQVHYTELGGQIVADYLWSKLKEIPLWRIPT